MYLVCKKCKAKWAKQTLFFHLSGLVRAVAEKFQNAALILRFSQRSKRFRVVWEQRRTEEWDFRYFAEAENGARAKKRKIYSLYLSPCNSLLPNRTETLATQGTTVWPTVHSNPSRNPSFSKTLFQTGGNRKRTGFAF